MKNIYYTYQLRDPRSPYPFYIGKGCRTRAWDHIKDNSNTHKANKIRKIIKDGFEVQVEILYNNLPENIAFAIEILLIKKFGRRDINTGCLTNQTNGGEGTTGRVATKEQLFDMSERQKLAMAKPEVKSRHKAAVKIAMNTPETKARVSASSKGRIVKPSTIELNRIRALGTNNPMYGKTGNKSPITGRKNVHNPYTLELKLISKDEAGHYLTNGWVLGRPPKQYFPSLPTAK